MLFKAQLEPSGKEYTGDGSASDTYEWREQTHTHTPSPHDRSGDTDS